MLTPLNKIVEGPGLGRPRTAASVAVRPPGPGLRRNADPHWIGIRAWSTWSWWWRRLLRCLLAEFFLGRLLLAALLGDLLLELFQPLLEQTNLG